MKYTVEVYSNGTVHWYKEGTKILHREAGPAVECANGSKVWYKEDNLHRLDGPAVECASGSKSWWKEGKRHRLDGPAIEWYDYKEYYVEGKQYSELEFMKLNKITYRTI